MPREMEVETKSGPHQDDEGGAEAEEYPLPQGESAPEEHLFV